MLHVLVAGILLCAQYLVEKWFANDRLVRLLPNYQAAGGTLACGSRPTAPVLPKVRSLLIISPTSSAFLDNDWLDSLCL